jgi:hypothetical protein
MLIHGYSDKGESFSKWKDIIGRQSEDGNEIRPVFEANACNYKTLTNEITIKDIAEAFDRALLHWFEALCEKYELDKAEAANQEFDAIVHSTGMLVIRAWLSTYAHRRGRLKRLVALAPATFGSPLAHRGRSWLGAIFKGNRNFGPDFLEAGAGVLDGLELGSRFTWDLAHKDMFGDKTCYGVGTDTPYVFVFCGNQAYGGPRALVNEPGTDGTVRWAGCPLNSRKISLDLTIDAARDPEKPRFSFSEWKNVDIPVFFVDGLNHGTILTEPKDELTELILEALSVDSEKAFRDVQAKAASRSAAAEPGQDGRGRWQQFVVHAVDERSDPIPDYNIQLIAQDANGSEFPIELMDLQEHPYSSDPSYRCYHVNVDEIYKLASVKKFTKWWVKVIASSGSELVGYTGFGYEERPEKVRPGDREWDAQLEITSLMTNEEVKLFFPWTTTLVELRMNREPVPFDRALASQICSFL